MLLRADGTRTRVRRVTQVSRVGVFAPHTLDGRIVVNGFVASTYTVACHPVLAHALLAPLRVAYRSFGITLSGALDRGMDAPLLAPIRVALSSSETVRSRLAESYWPGFARLVSSALG
jgi:hypothetical protein